MLPAPQLFQGPESVRELGYLGLTPDVFPRVFRAAHNDAMRTTDLDAPTARGLIRWLSTLRYLRHRLVPHGWSVLNVGSYCLTVHPDDQMAIAISAGNEHTGNPDEIPSSRNAKGCYSAQSVWGNQLTLDDIDGTFPRETAPPPALPRTTWILLYHAGPEPKELQAELSVPIGFDPRSRYNKWTKRIILDPVSFLPDVSIATVPDPGPTINVPVRRRAHGA